jgi:hypothetical protein
VLQILKGILGVGHLPRREGHGFALGKIGYDFVSSALGYRLKLEFTYVALRFAVHPGAPVDTIPVWTLVNRRQNAAFAAVLQFH